jgi:TM2 domain-containing membrane protein YozV
MVEEDKFEVIRQNASLLPSQEKIIFFELKKKSQAVGLLLAIFLFGGAGQIYAGKVVKGIIFILLSWLVITYIYAIWDTYKLIEEYNENLYLAVFDIDA